MKLLKKMIARLYDLPNAYRVLDIMDHTGCDISNVEDVDMWQITTKWYVTGQEAKDLQTICLFNRQYKERSYLLMKVIGRIFNVSEGSRVLKKWIG